MDINMYDIWKVDIIETSPEKVCIVDTQYFCDNVKAEIFGFEQITTEEYVPGYKKTVKILKLE